MNGSKVTVVTGASRGSGAAVARLASHGACCVHGAILDVPAGR